MLRHAQDRRTIALATIFAACGVAAPAAAQPLAPVFDQRQINSFTAGFQLVPDVDSFPGAPAVAVWESYGSVGNDASARSIQGRRFEVAGGGMGDQFQVNTLTADEQVAPRVAVAPGGQFAVVWQSQESSGGPAQQEIRARVYAANGTPLGNDFLVNTFTTGDQRQPDIAWGGDEYFVVVWESDDDTGASAFDWNIVGRLFAPTGAPLSAEFLMNTLGGEQLDPSVATFANGDFAVAWESTTSEGGDTTTKSIQVRVLGEAAETQVNDFELPVADDNPSIAVSPAGALLVAWESWGSAGTDSNRVSIQARLMGSVTTPVFQANTYTADDQRFPMVAFLPDGRFGIAWQSYGSSGSDASELSVQLRAFTADGTPVGNDLQANSYTNNNQQFPSLATSGDGGLVLAWESAGSNGGDISGPSIQARRFSLDLIFAASFEPGNLSEWSSHNP